ncbi:MAG: pseudouridine synthase [Oscillospiraceae bacterium]
MCGTPSQPSGILTDLLARDPQRRLTYVADTPSPSAREARLSFATVDSSDGMTLVRVRLHTGRTHQIRVQFASRGLPLAGDRKYGASDAPYPIALWSCRLSFVHPQTGEPVTFTCPPPDTAPWDLFTLPEML